MAVCGIDIGGTKCLGVNLDGGTVVGEVRVSTSHDAGTLVDELVGVVDALGSPSAMDAVGVGAPGLVDRDGVLGVAPNLKGGEGLPLRRVLEDRLGLPVIVDNDATCAAWGEHRSGAGRGFDDLVLATLGTGIGGGVVMGGQLQRGANGFAGEIGHMVIDPDGPRCPCGQRGCWETFASGTGLGRLARERAAGGGLSRVVALAGGAPRAVRGEHVTAAATEGDEPALDVLARFAWWVARGLANLADIFDPGAFVLGGGLVAAGDALLEPTRAALADLVLGGSTRPRISVLAAQLGERAGAVGAAYLAADHGPVG